MFNPGTTQTLMKILFPDINSVPFALIKTNFYEHLDKDH